MKYFNLIISVYEIEPARGHPHWDDYNACEIPCPATDGHMTTIKQLQTYE